MVPVRQHACLFRKIVQFFLRKQKPYQNCFVVLQIKIKMSQYRKIQNRQFEKHVEKLTLTFPFTVNPVSIFKQRQYGRQGNWTIKQKLKFCIFLQFHAQFFSKKANRRFFRLFKCLGYFLKSRTPAQCRSHYQKVKKTCSNQQKYIKSMRESVGQDAYILYLHLYRQELEMTRRYMGYQKKGSAPDLRKKMQEFKSLQNLRLLEQEYQNKSVNQNIIRTREATQKTISSFYQEYDKSQVIEKCNYHWQKYLEALLSLQAIIQQERLSKIQRDQI